MSKLAAVFLAFSTVALVPLSPRDSVPPETPTHTGPTAPDVPVEVSGQVVVRMPAPDPPPAMSPYSRRRSIPPQDPGTPGGPEDAFVYLEAMGGAASAPEPTPEPAPVETPPPAAPEPEPTPEPEPAPEREEEPSATVPQPSAPDRPQGVDPQA